jgi:hypothetical protein
VVTFDDDTFSADKLVVVTFDDDTFSADKLVVYEVHECRFVRGLRCALSLFESTFRTLWTRWRWLFSAPENKRA